MSTRIRNLVARSLNIPLTEPFTIATGRLDHVRNVLWQVTLENGITGLGESAPLEAITGENQATILATVAGCQALVIGQDARAWRSISADLAGSFHAQAAARAGIEMAILDALACTHNLPLYVWFGGCGSRVTTDMTIPIVPAEHARKLAGQIAASGINTVKTKVGKHVDDDVARIQAIREGHPSCELIIDANAGYTAAEALRVLDALERHGINPQLFEQPVGRYDWAGMRFVTEHTHVPVAADESVWSVADALRVVETGAARAINIKLMKSGIVEALGIAAIAHAAGLELMIGGMIESALAMTYSAHFAAGFGSFRYIDLDTPMLLSENPFGVSYLQVGGIYELASVEKGIGFDSAS